MPQPKILEIQSWVATQVSSYRLKHIQGVVRTAQKMARRFSQPLGKASLAGWLHDCAKELEGREMRRWIAKAGFTLDLHEKNIPSLWHPYAGAAIARIKWGVKDEAVLEAIQCHTLGRPKMGPLAELIFVADFIEPSRYMEDVEKVRALAFRNIKKAVLAKAALTIQHLLKKRKNIHPRLIDTWNYYLNT